MRSIGVVWVHNQPTTRIHHNVHVSKGHPPEEYGRVARKDDGVDVRAPVLELHQKWPHNGPCDDRAVRGGRGLGTHDGKPKLRCDRLIDGHETGTLVDKRANSNAPEIGIGYESVAAEHDITSINEFDVGVYESHGATLLLSGAATHPNSRRVIVILIHIEMVIAMMKTVQMTMPAPLLERLDRQAKAQEETRSAFIRAALKRELRRLEDAEHVRQFIENYEQMPETPEERAEAAAWASIQGFGEPEDWSDWE